MRTECSVVRDLLPLYLEDMVSPQTAEYVRVHLAECAACREELERMQTPGPVAAIEARAEPEEPDAKRFKKMLKRMNRQFHSLAYLLIIFFIFLGFGWTAGANLMYNSLIMPLVGLFGYYVFRWRAIYKVPALLLAIDLFVFALGLVALDFYAAMIWTLIYSLFALVGITIAFLLHYAFGGGREE